MTLRDDIRTDIALRIAQAVTLLELIDETVTSETFSVPVRCQDRVRVLADAARELLVTASDNLELTVRAGEAK